MSRHSPSAPRLSVVSGERPDPPYAEDPAGRTRLLANGYTLEVDVGRLYHADAWVLCPAEVRPWILMTWVTSWAQYPCGTLPGEDELIAARLGCTLDFFTLHRRHLLRDWVLHADGRWYHPLITAQVQRMLAQREGWRSRQGRRRGDATTDDVTHDTGVTHAGVTRDSSVSHAGVTGVSRPYSYTSPSSSLSTSPSRLVGVANATVAFAGGEPDPTGVDPDPPAAEHGETTAVAPRIPAPVQEVFGYWQAVMDHPQARLDTKRRRAIAARLKEGYTVEQLKAAITGCKASAWHQGQNDRHQVFDDIELICRDAQRVEAFLTRGTAKTAQQRELEAWLNEDEGVIEGECRHV